MSDGQQNGQSNPSGKQFKKERKRLTDLSLTEQRTYREIERILRPIIQTRQHNKAQGKSSYAGRGKLTAAREAIATLLGVPLEEFPERTIQSWIAKYEQRMNDPDYKNAPERWIDALIPNQGREAVSTVLTEDHLLAIKTALLKRDRESEYEDGSVHVVDLPIDMLFSEDIYEYAQALCPDLPSIDTVRREVARLKEERPAYYKLLLEGLDALHRDTWPKRKHDVSGVDEVWTFDEVYPPIFIQHEGRITRPAMLDLIDMHTDYRIHHRVLPLIEVNSQDEVKNIDIKIVDVARFMGTGMWKPNRRPDWFYSDRDGRFKHIAENNYLHDLTMPDETPIQMHLARVREPWSRGQKETSYWRELHKFLRRFPGYYGPGSPGKRKIRAKIKDPSELLTVEELEKNLEGFYRNVNRRPNPSERKQVERKNKDRAKGNKRKPRTREQMYFEGIPPYTSPPIRRLAYLPLESVDDWGTFDHRGLSFKGDKFAPYVTNASERPMLYLRWMNAAESEKPVRYYAVYFDRIGWRAEIELDGVWYEAMPRDEIELPNQEHMEARFAANTLIEAQIEADRQEIIREALERFGQLPLRSNTAVSDAYRMPGQSQAATDEPEETDTEATDGQSQSGESKTSSQTVQASNTESPSTTRQKKSPIDWSKRLNRKPE